MVSTGFASSEHHSGHFTRKKVIGISRKDTVIIAVLVNIALLAILFALAGKDKESSSFVSSVSTESPIQVREFQEVKASIPEKSFDKKAPVDEIDQILQEFANQVSSGTVATQSTKACSNASSTTAAKNNKSSIEVKVQKGDSIAKIAKAYGVTIEDILAYNNLPNEKLKIGQILQIPRNKQPTSDLSKNVAVANQIAQPVLKDAQGGEYYVIRSGDNPWKIARKFGLKYEDLLRLNSLDEESAKNLKVGQRIRIK